MEVAIVGANGFLGRHLCDALRDRGHRSLAILRGARAVNADRSMVLDLQDPSGPSRLAEALVGVDVLVNLAGLKRGAQAELRAAHVGIPQAICAAARAAETPRIIHISVAGCRDDPRSIYMSTKAQGEAVLRGSGLAVTILRPGVIYGDGDDLLRNLAAMILHSPIFPAPGGGRAQLQPVAVADVTAAIIAAMDTPLARGRTYDIVSTARVQVRELVRQVARVLEEPLWIAAAPLFVMRPAAAIIERVFADPPITQAQLGLLTQGVTGDPEPARTDLGVEPKPLDDATIRRLCAGATPWLGLSLRPLWITDQAALASASRALPRALGVLPLAVGLPLGLCLWLGDLWMAMPLAYAALVPITLALVPLPYRDRLRLSWRALVTGIVAALVLYGLGSLVLSLLARFAPAIATQLTALELVALSGAGLWFAPALVLTVVGEELVFRTALLLPLAGTIGPWRAVVVSAALYTLAHAAAGPPLLLVAAAGAGLFWGALHLRSGSLTATILCHLLWDIAVIALAPYSASLP